MKNYENSPFKGSLGLSVEMKWKPQIDGDDISQVTIFQRGKRGTKRNLIIWIENMAFSDLICNV